MKLVPTPLDFMTSMCMYVCVGTREFGIADPLPSFKVGRGARETRDIYGYTKFVLEECAEVASMTS